PGGSGRALCAGGTRKRAAPQSWRSAEGERAAKCSSLPNCSAGNLPKHAVPGPGGLRLPITGQPISTSGGSGEQQRTAHGSVWTFPAPSVRVMVPLASHERKRKIPHILHGAVSMTPCGTLGCPCPARTTPGRFGSKKSVARSEERQVGKKPCLFLPVPLTPIRGQYGRSPSTSSPHSAGPAGKRCSTTRLTRSAWRLCLP